MKRGLFIAFEGIEGVGKSTQAKNLYDFFLEKGMEVFLTREPGGTDLGESIREILINGGAMHEITELLLMLASRNELVRTKILPYLDKGKYVISDRFYMSSLAYQGGGRGLNLKFVNRLNKIVTAGLKPDLTFILDMPVDASFKRKSGKRDRFEQEVSLFYEKVRKTYLYLAKKAPKKVKIIDAGKESKEVFKEVLFYVKQYLLTKGVIL